MTSVEQQNAVKWWLGKKSLLEISQYMTKHDLHPYIIPVGEGCKNKEEYENELRLFYIQYLSRSILLPQRGIDDYNNSLITI